MESDASGRPVLYAGVRGGRRRAELALLAHPKRQRILTILAEAPGLYTAQVAHRIPTSFHDAAYHLRVLKRAGLVASRHQDGQELLFRVGDDRIQTVLSSLRAQTPRSRILRAVREHPGLPLQALARHIGLPYPNMHYYVERMVRSGEIGRERIAGRVVLSPTADCAPQTVNV